MDTQLRRSKARQYIAPAGVQANQRSHLRRPRLSLRNGATELGCLAARCRGKDTNSLSVAHKVGRKAAEGLHRRRNPSAVAVNDRYLLGSVSEAGSILLCGFYRQELLQPLSKGKPRLCSKVSQCLAE